MARIGSDYPDNLKRVKNLAEHCIGMRNDAALQNIGILVTPLKENALCYECIKPIDKDGINVLILNHKGLIEREEYNFHRFHYAKN